LPVGGASADKVLRVAMTASDIPTTGGIPNNGGEGSRFLGYTAYDALVNWDFKHTDQTADVTPGLAASWEVVDLPFAQGGQISRRHRLQRRCRRIHPRPDL
jgi:hypothetical protein